MPIKNIVLVGSTGTIGPAIYQALKSTPSKFSITILTRPCSTSKQPEGAKVISFSYDDPALVDAFKGQDAIVTSVSGQATLSQIPLIDAAAKAGVKKFIATEQHTQPRHPPLLPAYAQKKAVHSHLVQTAKEDPGFSYAALITGPLFAFGIQTGFLGYDLKNQIATIVDGGDLQVSYTDIPQVALANLIRYASQNEIVAALEKITGEKFERKEETTKHYEELSKQMMQSGDLTTRDQGVVYGILRVAYGAHAEPGWGRGDKDILGLEESNLEDLVKVALGDSRT